MMEENPKDAGGICMAKKAKRVAQKYIVNMELKTWDIAKAGSAVTLSVKDRNGALGTIQIGQGSFRWKPAHGKMGFRRISWRNLAAALNEYY
jgi:hypothetical protein